MKNETIRINPLQQIHGPVYHGDDTSLAGFTCYEDDSEDSMNAHASFLFAVTAVVFITIMMSIVGLVWLFCHHPKSTMIGLIATAFCIAVVTYLSVSVEFLIERTLLKHDINKADFTGLLKIGVFIFLAVLFLFTIVFSIEAIWSKGWIQALFIGLLMAITIYHEKLRARRLAD